MILAFLLVAACALPDLATCQPQYPAALQQYDVSQVSDQGIATVWATYRSGKASERVLVSMSQPNVEVQVTVATYLGPVTFFLQRSAWRVANLMSSDGTTRQKLIADFGGGVRGGWSDGTKPYLAVNWTPSQTDNLQ